jgi:GrpB-like predicted nucleotidyltransferase (UPF0157 family)
MSDEFTRWLNSIARVGVGNQLHVKHVGTTAVAETTLLLKDLSSTSQVKSQGVNPDY